MSRPKNINPDLTLAELAQLLQRNQEALRRRVAEGAIPGAYRVGRVWRFRRDAIERLRRGEAAS